MSKNLVNIIDIAILPASLMIVSKFIGFILSIYVFNIDWNLVTPGGNIWMIRPTVPAEYISLVSTYSNLFMLVIMSIALTFIIVQATVLHSTHIKPSLLAKMHNYNLMGLVKGSMKIYHSATIWIIFIWIGSVVTLIDTALGNTEVWVGLLGIISSSIFTGLLLYDVYKEIDIGKISLGKMKAFE